MSMPAHPIQEDSMPASGKTQVERCIEDACAEVRSTLRGAIESAALYGFAGDVIVLDGSQYSPSSRALMAVEDAWQSLPDDEVAEVVEAVHEYIDTLSIDGWSLGWDDGILWAVRP